MTVTDRAKQLETKYREAVLTAAISGAEMPSLVEVIQRALDEGNTAHIPGGELSDFNPTCQCPKCGAERARLFEKHVGPVGPRLNEPAERRALLESIGLVGWVLLREEEASVLRLAVEETSRTVLTTP